MQDIRIHLENRYKVNAGAVPLHELILEEYLEIQEVKIYVWNCWFYWRAAGSTDSFERAVKAGIQGI